MNTDITIIVKPTPGLAPQEARDTRARAWAYVFACFERHQSKKTVTHAPSNGPEDVAPPSFQDAPGRQRRSRAFHLDRGDQGNHLWRGAEELATEKGPVPPMPWTPTTTKEDGKPL